MLLNTVMSCSVGQERKNQTSISKIISILEGCSFVATWILETEFNLLFLKLVGRLFQSEHASLELLVSYLTW